MKLYDVLCKDSTDRLKATVRRGGSVEVSRVKVIGLEDIRRGAGEAWPQIAARVRTNALYFLERRMGPGDVVVASSEGFVIVYGEQTGDTAEAKSVELQEALNHFFLGQETEVPLLAQVEHSSVAAGDLAAMLAPDPGAPAEAANVPPPAPPTIEFLSVWNVSQQTITSYWPLPVYPGNGLVHYCYDLAWGETGTHSGADFLPLDLENLASSVAAIEQFLLTGRRCLVGYYVHATTMQHRERRKIFLRRLADAPEAVRAYLVGCIAAVEPGTPAVTLAEWVHQLRPLSLRVAVELHHTERVLGGLEGVGAYTVCCPLPVKQSMDSDRRYCSNLIQKWGVTLRRQGIKFRLDNIVDARLMMLAANGGVDFGSNCRVWPLTEAPMGMRPYTKEQLYQALGANESAGKMVAL